MLKKVAKNSFIVLLVTMFEVDEWRSTFEHTLTTSSRMRLITATTITAYAAHHMTNHIWPHVPNKDQVRAEARTCFAPLKRAVGLWEFPGYMTKCRPRDT